MFVLCYCLDLQVTPFVGVWIETDDERSYFFYDDLSHPSWVCGLKPHLVGALLQAVGVTPFVGVWIETC